MVAEPMIEIADVTWRYAGADTPTLAGLNLRIEQGETVVLCGASGSGKSTALRLVNGLIPHFHRGTLEGIVRLDGEPIAEQRLDVIGRQTGTVLQHPRRQFFTDSVDTELAFASENFGAPPQLIRARVAAARTEHRLTDLTGRRLFELSGGQQQQVAFAAATVHRPAVVVLDEPTANLSAAAVEQFIARIAELRAAGVTLVIAEHRLHRLADQADRIILLRDGRVTTEWSGADFARLPEKVWTAEGLRRDLPATRVLPRVFGHGPSVEPARRSPRQKNPAGGSEPSRGLTLHEIRCTRKGRPVLDIADAHFPAATVTAVTGPNGAGKSTLAHVLTGLQRHSGVITLDGRRLSRRRRLADAALVMQDVQRQLFADSVAAELRLWTDESAAGRTDPSGAPSESTSHPLLRALGLAGLDDRHPLALSGGQQQRLVVAGTRLIGRRIVVFDEPSSGVDARHLASITDVLRGLATDGAVVILISHDDELVTRAADLELRLRSLPDPVGTEQPRG
ncbi:ABC transporter ATP-binding protein [Nocardia sp. NPDC049220]|uniref:ABC transporter ATP-binding protein n=1 Tax=Nocardia sp. NPDC049220 TaxID=3155273 RepID=UPI0033DD8A0F